MIKLWAFTRSSVETEKKATKMFLCFKTQNYKNKYKHYLGCFQKFELKSEQHPYLSTNCYRSTSNFNWAFIDQHLKICQHIKVVIGKSF